MKRRMIRSLAVLVGLVVVLMVLPAGVAFADAGSHASCVGLESSGISPVGSSDEFPGGRPQLNQVLREAFPGVPIGAIVSQVAKIHAGSHEGCDEATE
ncbi:MAG: hypothetical protein WAT66_00550 [Actinomycetota bacterium]